MNICKLMSTSKGHIISNHIINHGHVEKIISETSYNNMFDNMSMYMHKEGIFSVLIDKFMISTVIISKIKGKINYE